MLFVVAAATTTVTRHKARMFTIPVNEVFLLSFDNTEGNIIHA